MSALRTRLPWQGATPWILGIGLSDTSRRSSDAASQPLRVSFAFRVASVAIIEFAHRDSAEATHAIWSGETKRVLLVEDKFGATWENSKNTFS